MKARPSLDTLRFFEVASRRLSFTAAAEELFVTHGAVSQRIKILEEYLGVPLFERRGRSMVLTSYGQELRPLVATAIWDLDRAFNSVYPRQPSRALTISVLPIFAARWLIPRLSSFNDLHPEINVNIRADQAHADFDRDDVDLAVRFGNGRWLNVQIDKLFDEELLPVCSPKLLNVTSIKEHSQLLSTKLLHDSRQPWSIWFEAVGLKISQQPIGPMYLDSNLLLEAALAGHGIALGRASLVQPEIDAGRLIRIFPKGVKATASHYVVHAIGSDKKEKVAKFKKWILSQAKIDELDRRRERRARI